MGAFALTVTDVFSITGRGTVVTGQVTLGAATVGEPVFVRGAAGETATRIEAIESFGRKRGEAHEGEDVGLMLFGVTRDQVARGDQVFRPPNT